MKRIGFNSSMLVAMTLSLFFGVAWQNIGFADDTQVSAKPAQAASVEKKQDEEKLKQSDQYAGDQARALNKIPGVSVSSEDLKETAAKKKGSAGLNPIGWLFKPITQLQQQSVRLEQQMMKLTGPIAALQPGMLRLEKRIVGVEGQTEKVQTQMSAMQTDITAMRQELAEIKKPVEELKEPILSLREPIRHIEKPITGVDKDLAEVKALLSLVLTSIYIAAAVIAIGTPIAAILVWRNREKFIPAKPHEQREERALQGTATQIDRQLRKGA